jgi:hypothetical protein
VLHHAPSPLLSNNGGGGGVAAASASVVPALEVLVSNCAPASSCEAAVQNASRTLGRVAWTSLAPPMALEPLRRVLSVSLPATRLFFDQYRCARCEAATAVGCERGTVVHRKGLCPVAKSSSFWQQIQRLRARLQHSRHARSVHRSDHTGAGAAAAAAPVATPQGAPSEPARLRDGVALCLAGWHRTALPQQGWYTRNRVAEPLHAQTLLALTYRRTETCTGLDRCGGLRERLSRLQPITRLSLEAMPTVSELLAMLESLPHWPRVLQAFNSTRHWRPFHRVTVGGRIYLDTRRPRNVTCARQPWHAFGERQRHPLGGQSSPYLCDGLKEWGNTIFAPVIGPSNGNVLWQLHSLHRVHSLLREQERARGLEYARVVVSRLDFVWLSPHPPLLLLDERCVWAPMAEDYGGLNDRHAVLSRPHADAYLGRWDMIRDGRILRLHPQLRSGTANGLSGERTLASLLRAIGAPVCRFAPVAFLACCSSLGQASNHTQHGSSRSVRGSSEPSRCRNSRCHRIRVPSIALEQPEEATPPIDARGKYVGELRSSVQHALALSLPNSTWAHVDKGTTTTTKTLGILAERRFALSFNATLRRALHSRGMGGRSSLLRWVDGRSHPAHPGRRRLRAPSLSSDATSPRRLTTSTPRLCLLTLAREVPHPSIAALASQHWYPRFAHIVFHERGEPADFARAPRHARFVNVTAFFKTSSQRVRRPREEEVCSTDRATTARYPPTYRAMCAFWYADFLTYVEDCDYALRVDGDCVLARDQPDPTLSLPRAIASTHWQGPDKPWVVRGMHQFFEGRDRERAARPDANASAATSSSTATNLSAYWQQWSSPYTNVMWMNLSWVRGQRETIEAVNRTECIFTSRWGDLPLWGATLHMQRQASQLLDLSYEHGSHGVVVRAGRRVTPARRLWLTARPSALQPRLLEWRNACATTRRVSDVHSKTTTTTDASSRLVRVLAAVWAASSGEPRLSSDTSLNEAIEAGIRRLEEGLHRRGVLCDASAPCTVHREQQNTAGGTAEHGVAIRVCLPNATLGSRICEPFGADAQRQVGLDVWRVLGSACVSFDLPTLARLWASLRAKAPFVSRGDLPLPAYEALLRAKSRGSHTAERAAHFEAELEALLINETATSAHPAKRLGRCAIVGSNHDLRCSRSTHHGAAIDAADAILRYDHSQQFGLSKDPRGFTLLRMRMDVRRAGRRTTHRVGRCLFSSLPLAPARQQPSSCIVGRAWWRMRWGRESLSDNLRECCEKPMRSSYNVSRLVPLAHRGSGGSSLLWLAPAFGHAATIGAARESAEESEALLAAMGMCEEVELFGSGLLRIGGGTLEAGLEAGELVEAHAYDQRVGRCAERTAAHLQQQHQGDAPNGLRQIRGELLRHVMHAFGLITWIQ